MKSLKYIRHHFIGHASLVLVLTQWYACLRFTPISIPALFLFKSTIELRHRKTRNLFSEKERKSIDEYIIHNN